MHASTVPNLNVAGFWDQEDPWGPWQIFRHAGESDPEHTDFIVAGPWYHGEWQSAKGDSIGIIPFGTGNVMAQNLKIPKDPAAAARWILRSRPRSAALGRVTCCTEGGYY